MIEKLWLYPPLAIARVGSSSIPCDNFSWGPNPNPNDVLGKTVIVPTETLHVAEDGTITSTIPEKVIFKDENGFRPVCPFFELFGQWTKDNRLNTGPITLEVLKTFNLSLADIDWQVNVANLKAFNYTKEEGDKIVAELKIQGDDNNSYNLLGKSPKGIDEQRQILPTSKEEHVLFGTIQLTKPTTEYPEIRLRFIPGKGNTYGPTNLNTDEKPSGSSFGIPEERTILNKSSNWCNYQIIGTDARNAPSLLYPREGYFGGTETSPPQKSLGIIDDICDGIISCSIRNTNITAFARIVVGPPKYSPDRRPFTSLADGLKDRISRNDIFDPTYFDDKELTFKELKDFIERIYETMHNYNLDYRNNFPPTTIRQPTDDRPFDPSLFNPTDDNKLPLTRHGRDRHQSLLDRMEKEKSNLLPLLNIIIFMLRSPPDRFPFESFVDDTRFIDIRRYRDGPQPNRRPGKMPALMRGSDGFPMHITRRQYNFIIEYIKKLQEDTNT